MPELPVSADESEARARLEATLRAMRWLRVARMVVAVLLVVAAGGLVASLWPARTDRHTPTGVGGAQGYHRARR
jgi:hypothetical protein